MLEHEVGLAEMGGEPKGKVQVQGQGQGQGAGAWEGTLVCAK